MAEAHIILAVFIMISIKIMLLVRKKEQLTVVLIKRKVQHMKKSIVIIAAVVVLSISGLALAQMNEGKEMKAGMMGKGMMEGKGMMMHGMMMNAMMNKSMVATSDGGVVVMTANKLTKYDKDLNVVKEIELKMDMEGMQKMMKDCPMMGKGMMGNMGGDAETTAEKTAPAKEVDHASHH